MTGDIGGMAVESKNKGAPKEKVDTSPTKSVKAIDKTSHKPLKTKGCPKRKRTPPLPAPISNIYQTVSQHTENH